MYLTAYKKNDLGEFEKDYRWDEAKYTNRYDFYCLLREDSISEECRPEYAHFFDYYPPYIRPKKISAVREKLKKSTFRENHAFYELLDLMKKDKNVFVKYE